MASSVGAAVRSGVHGWMECVRVAAGRRSDRERGWGLADYVVLIWHRSAGGGVSGLGMYARRGR